MDALLTGLNDAQRCAVTSPASALQVLAPPGSGKTKTLTARVAYLISNAGLLPWNIVVCTFTIKAAREMKERIRGLVGDGIESQLILGTFHSVARRFLVSYGHHIGIEKNFAIADSSDSLAIIRRIIKRRNFSAEASIARSRISGLKARSVSCNEYLATSKTTDQREFGAIYSEYEESLKASNLLDYDDLLLRCVDLLKRYPICVSNIEAVLIDEFQDTNHVQYELMRLFSQCRNTITIVGDPDQSIYGFRSAEIKNLKRMQQQYETTVVILEDNYRSSGSILLSAMEVIEQDESRPAKKLQSTHCVGVQPILRRLPSAAVEATWIVSEIERTRILNGNLLSHSDFAILLRSAALSRQIESALGKVGIPYRMVGGHRFFDRVEIKNILDYLRVISQPDHNDALVRIINVPPRKIGDATVSKLLEEAESNNMTLWALILKAAQGNRRPGTKLTCVAEKGIESLANLILTCRRKLANSEPASFSLVDLINHILKRISFEDYLKRKYPDDFEARWANVEELMAQAFDMSESLSNGVDLWEDSLPAIDGINQRELSESEDALAKFLANVALSTEVQQESNREVEQVTISTIHAAKGLEWPIVFIPATYEGSIPHSRAEDTDEERRLLYVGMTRAQTLLYLSWPLKNSQNSGTTLSPFLSPPNMAKFFGDKGPSFSFSVTQDLAHILRRDCPSDPVIRHARTLVDRLEDDLWPVDGQESNTNSNTYGWLDSTHDPSFGNALKRRKLDNDVMSVSAATTTMGNREHFSVSSTTLRSGFVTANSHYEVLKQQQAAQALAQRIENPPSREVTKHDKQNRLLSRARRRVAGQGSITSFFKQDSEATPGVQADPSSSKSQPQTLKPLQDISNSALDCYPSNRLIKIPKAATIPGRPRKIEQESMHEKAYAFLSSSPAKPEEDDPVQAPVDGLASPTRTTSLASIRQPGLAREGVHDFRPASTFHTTTMAQTSEGIATQRRTLGMRRSVKGWNSNVNKPFTVPGKRK